jgi:hypothetical protein
MIVLSSIASMILNFVRSLRKSLMISLTRTLIMKLIPREFVIFLVSMVSYVEKRIADLSIVVRLLEGS